MGKFYDFILDVAEKSFESRRKQLESMYNISEIQAEISQAESTVPSRPMKRLETQTERSR